MAFALQTEDLAVGELFSGRFTFVLPEFQREYSWAAEEAEHLFDDLSAALLDRERDAETAPFFLGTMLFAEPGPEAPLRDVQIVDGQQRITTLTILLAVLRDLEKDADAKSVLHRAIAVWSTSGDELADQFHLTPRSVDRSFLARSVQKIGATGRPRRRTVLTPKTPAQRNFETVRTLFRKRLQKAEPEFREQLARFVLDDCRIVSMRTESLDYAYQMFLTINRRGLPLTDDDIVIAEVIGPLDAEQKRRFAPIVEQMSRYREADEKSRLRGKTFYSHLVALNGWSPRSMISDLRKTVAASGGAQNFTRSVFQPMADAYLLTRCEFENQQVTPELAEQLQRLALLERSCDDEWVGSAMLGLRHYSLEDPALILFLRHLDRFAHAQLAIRPMRSERRNRYRRAMNAIRTVTGTLKPADVFALSANEQSKVLRRCAVGLNDTTSRTGKAFLMRIDAHISGRPASYYLDVVTQSETEGGQISVEHVLPKGRSLPRGSGWRVDFPQHDQRRVIADCLGNLLLVGELQNRRVAQQDWLVKRDAFLEDPVSQQFALVKQLAGTELWTQKQIAERHVILMHAVREIWGLEGPVPPVPPATESEDGQKLPTRPGRRRSPMRRS